MFMTRIIYTSTVTDKFKPNDIEDILTTARKYNDKNAITGLLVFNSKTFLQCLEGSRIDVNSTYNRILSDPRHRDVILLDYRDIDEREFDTWSMGYVPSSSLTTDVNIKYSATRNFNPYHMSGKSVHGLLLSLKDAVPTI